MERRLEQTTLVEEIVLLAPARKTSGGQRFEGYVKNKVHILFKHVSYAAFAQRSRSNEVSVVLSYRKSLWKNRTWDSSRRET